MNKKRETIRKGLKKYKNVELFLYGRLKQIHKAIAYCQLHK